ncbi:MAG: cupin domain-containing protein [Chlorobi bacterium]|nr:cupin domain-containing protein [Chlorobiota bacterium]MCI0715208.1 cupin domain-containing protein [Chlorobiota bacterium]
MFTPIKEKKSNVFIDDILDNKDNLKVITPEEELLTKQNLPHFIGISKNTAGSKGICMNLCIIPAGGQGVAHVHKGFESAIYIMEGTVEVLYGRYLNQSSFCKKGDFVYIDADVPHVPVNLSKTKPALAIVTRTGADEQETVVLYNAETDTLIENKKEFIY